jgi:PadR family transcriptional regulator, regulatory protein AphA
MRMGIKSFAVLGLVDQLGEATAYDIKLAAQPGMSMLWPLTHTGLYAECQRLASAHLITGARECCGRNRVVYRMTGAGRDVLADWLRRPVTAIGQLREPGLVQLYLGADPVLLARPQLFEHRARLQTLENLVVAATNGGDTTHALPFSGLMRIEIAWEQFWKGVGNPETPAAA